MSEHAILSNQLEQAKSSHGEVTLPCGFIHNDQLLTRVSIREIDGHAEDMLASDKIKPIAKLTNLLARCTVQLGDISDPDFIKKAVREMTIGDRSWLILSIRRYTLGDIYPYTYTCPNTNCGAKKLYQVDLRTLETRKMADPMRRVYEVELPLAKVTARFHVMTGVDEEEVAKYAGETVSRTIHTRIEQLGDKRPTLAEVQALRMLDREALREAFDDVEAGVDTEIEMKCPDCSHEFATELDIAQQGFFFPSRVRKVSKRKSSS
jgi:hypothetical protein